MKVLVLTLLDVLLQRARSWEAASAH
jgi:hypothetical protein